MEQYDLIINFFWIRTGNLYICKDNSGIFFFQISIPRVDGYSNFFLTKEKLLKSLRPRIYDSSNRRCFPTYKHTITKENLIINKQSSFLCLKTSQRTNFSWPFIGMVDGDSPIDQLRPNMNPISMSVTLTVPSLTLISLGSIIKVWFSVKVLIYPQLQKIRHQKEHDWILEWYCLEGGHVPQRKSKSSMRWMGSCL